GGRTIPLQMSLAFTEDEAGAEVEEILFTKRQMRASFVLDSEAGPYNFASVTYFIEDGRMDMIYLRAIDGSSAIPRFRLTGTMKNGTFQGRALTASQGDIGTFSMARVGGSDMSLSVVPKYGGVFRGTMKMSGTNIEDNITVLLSPGGGVDTNPTSYDFDFSPRKTGSIDVSGSVSLAFTRVNIDYIRGTLEMTSVGGSGELTLRGNLSNTIIKGSAASSRASGTFEVRKAQ
ncbi:MAG: hypothetical protein K2X47_08775, partial [Bdellovibrionales bacterium]|nr:hypothetical protein [Bdellovibrionales bacterium]